MTSTISRFCGRWFPNRLETCFSRGRQVAGPTESSSLIAQVAGRKIFRDCFIEVILRKRKQTSHQNSYLQAILSVLLPGIGLLGSSEGRRANIFSKASDICETSATVWIAFRWVAEHFKKLSENQAKLFPRPSPPHLRYKEALEKTKALGTVVLFEILPALFSHLPAVRRCSSISDVVQIVSGIFFRTYSLFLTRKNGLPFLKSLGSSKEAKEIRLKLLFIDWIYRTQRKFISLKEEERNDFTSSIKKVRESDSETKDVEYLNEMQKLLPEFFYDNPPWKKIAKVFFFFATSLYPVTILAMTNWYDAKCDPLNRGECREVDVCQPMSNVKAAAFASLTYSILYLNARSAFRTFRQFVPLKLNLTSQINKIQALGHKGLSVLISALGTYGFFKSGEHAALPFYGKFGLALYAFFIQNALTNEITSYALEQISLSREIAEGERDNMLLQREFAKILELFEMAPLHLFMDYFHSLPDNIKNPFLLKVGLLLTNRNRAFESLV